MYDRLHGAYLVSNAGVAQLVERHLAKVQVAGSNPVSRSILCAAVKLKARCQRKSQVVGMRPLTFALAVQALYGTDAASRLAALLFVVPG